MYSIEYLVQFQDGRTDAYLTDKSMISIIKSTIMYFLCTGTKTKLKIQSIQKQSELSLKMLQIFKIHNQYSDRYYHFPKLIQQQYITKLIKINSFSWGSYNQGAFLHTDKGFKLISLDTYASIELDYNLLLVNVEYLQILNDKQIQKFSKNNTNYMKQLFRKYKMQYSGNLEDSTKISVAYKYKKVKKTFFIMNLPQRWHYPCSLIWKYLTNNQFLKETLMFEFQTDLKEVPTHIQQIIPFQKQQGLNICSLPLLRNPNHISKCQYIMSRQYGMIWLNENGAVGYDLKKGVWIQNNETFHLLFKNSIKSAKFYNINAIPLIIRVDNYQNQVKQFLNLMVIYFNHYKSISSQEKQNQVQQFYQISESANQVGTFKAYSNKIIKANFLDRTMVTYYHNTKLYKIVTMYADIVQFYEYDHRFKYYIEQVLGYYQQIFDKQNKVWRQSMKNYLEQKIMDNKNMIMILKGRVDEPKQQQIKQLSEINIEQRLQKNEQFLRELKKLKHS